MLYISNRLFAHIVYSDSASISKYRIFSCRSRVLLFRRQNLAIFGFDEFSNGILPIASSNFCTTHESYDKQCFITRIFRLCSLLAPLLPVFLGLIFEIFFAYIISSSSVFLSHLFNCYLPLLYVVLWASINQNTTNNKTSQYK